MGNATARPAFWVLAIGVIITVVGLLLWRPAADGGIPWWITLLLWVGIGLLVAGILMLILGTTA